MSNKKRTQRKLITKCRYVKYVIMILLLMLFGGCSKQEQETQEVQEEEVQEKEAQEIKVQEVELKSVTEPIFIAEGIRGIHIVKQDEDIMSITYEPQDYEATFEYWNMRIPYNNEVVVDTEAMLMLYQQLVVMDIQKTPIPNETVVNFDKPFGKITVNFCQTTEDERIAAAIGQAFDKEKSPSYQLLADSTATLLIGESDGEGNYYVAYEGGENNVALLSQEIVDAVLNIKPFDYILNVSAVANRETIQSVTIEFDDKSYELSEKQLEEQVYQTLYNELLSVFVVEEIPDASQITEAALLDITLKRNVKDAVDLHITYHPWDEERYAVKVNEEAFFLVNSTDVEALKMKISEVFAK